MYHLLILISGVGACFVLNPVQSLIWLIVTFIVGAVFTLELGGELLAVLLLLVYIGAIAVLFLFVVMLLNIRKVELNSLVINYFPIGVFVGVLLMISLTLMWYMSYVNIEITNSYLMWISFLNYVSNIESIGYLLYFLYCHYFLLLSIILVIALIGAVLLVK